MSNKDTNLSQQQQIEQLQKKVDFLTSILDTLPFNVFAKDTECRYIYNNKYSNNINKVEPGGLYGKSDFDLWPSKDLAQQYYELDKKQILEKTSYRDYIATLDNNEITYQEMFKEPILDKENNVTGVLGVVIPPASINKIKNDIERSFNDKNPSIIFDYYFKDERFVILKKIENYSIFKDNKIDHSCIFPDDLHILYEINEELLTQPANIIHLIRIYNDKKEIQLCRIELHCYYDQEMNPSRISGLIRPISKENLKDEIINIEIINAKKGIFSKIRDSYDLCVYVNPVYNYYYIYQSGSIFRRIQQVGEWNNLIDIFFEYLHPSDFGILKNIFLTLNLYNDDEIPSNKYREFRIRENDGTYRWKSFEAQSLKNAQNDAFLLFFFDVNDSVLERQKRNLKEINSELIDVLSTVVEFRDMESGEHIIRIKTFTRILLNTATRLFSDITYSKELIDIISSASAMHDIGKIAIPDNILLKPDKLTTEEFEIMKQHTIKGCEILETIPQIQEATYYKYSYDICRHHHERYDGRGYPDGLKGDEISLEAQIVSVADVFDALTSSRCYKEAFSFEKAASMIVNGECGNFSERILKCFNEALPELKKFCEEHK